MTEQEYDQRADALKALAARFATAHNETQALILYAKSRKGAAWKEEHARLIQIAAALTLLESALTI